MATLRDLDEDLKKVLSEISIARDELHKQSLTRKLTDELRSLRMRLRLVRMDLDVILRPICIAGLLALPVLTPALMNELQSPKQFYDRLAPSVIMEAGEITWKPLA